MMKVIFASSDGHKLYDGHFGDADCYVLYEVNGDEAHRIDIIENRTKGMKENDTGHGDPDKARSVAGLFKEMQVSVVVNRAFGPNINRMKRHFIPVVASYESIEDACGKLLEKYDLISEILASDGYEPVRI